MASTDVACGNSVNTVRRCAYGSIPLPFVLVVLVGADISLAISSGCRTNLLIRSTGGYRSAVCLRAGVPLILMLWLALFITLPLWYDFRFMPNRSNPFSNRLRIA